MTDTDPVGEPPCKCGHGPDDHDSEGICCRVHPDFPLRLIPCVARVPVNDEAEAKEAAVQKWWAAVFAPYFTGTNLEAMNLRLAYEAGWDDRAARGEDA